MAKRRAGAPSQRQLRVGEEVRHALAWVLERGEIRDPGLQGITVTVTEVRISPDLRNATAYIVPLGGGDVEPILAALTRARSFLRRHIAAAVRLQFAPNLSFAADTSFDQASRIDGLLRGIDKPAGDETGGGDADG